MNLAQHANSAAELTALPIDGESVHEFGALVPVTATPATAVAAGAGVAAGAAVVGAVAAGAAVGEAID